MAMLGAVAGIAGSGLSMFGALQQGQAAKAAGEYQYAADVAAGKQALAESQIPMINQQDKLAKQQGTFIANAAGSGAGGGATVKDLYDQMASRGETQADTELSKGQQRQNAFITAGQNAKYMGDAAQSASLWNAAGSGLSGLSKVNWGALSNSGSDFNFG